MGDFSSMGEVVVELDKTGVKVSLFKSSSAKPRFDLLELVHLLAGLLCMLWYENDKLTTSSLFQIQRSWKNKATRRIIHTHRNREQVIPAHM